MVRPQLFCKRPDDTLVPELVRLVGIQLPLEDGITSALSEQTKAGLQAANPLFLPFPPAHSRKI